MTWVSNLILFIYIVISFNFLKKNGPGFVFIYLALLLITPWFWILFFGEPPIAHMIGIRPYGSLILGNVEQMLSFDSLFFRSSGKIFYIVGNLGYFLPSFIPLILIGIWHFISAKSKRFIYIFLTLLGTSVICAYFLGLFSAFLFLPFVSIFAVFGFYNFWQGIKDNDFIRVIFFLNLFFLIYEGLRLFRIIFMQSMAL